MAEKGKRGRLGLLVETGAGKGGAKGVVEGGGAKDGPGGAEAKVGPGGAEAKVDPGGCRPRNPLWFSWSLSSMRHVSPVECTRENSWRGCTLR